MWLRQGGWSLAVLLVVLGVAGQAHAAEERRVALIIGNDAYKQLKRLDNGANDARAIERELKAAGFETVLKTNAGRKEMHNAIDEFGGKLATGSVGLFYFAGHGIQAGDKNYLIPVDADLQSEADLDADAIDAGKVMRSMEAARNRLNIVILDACRDNPLPKAGRSGSRGLAVMPAPTGTFVAYATGPGKKAEDGDRGSNGIYTGELVKALRQPGLKIEDVFKQAATGVMEKTGGKQVPWTQASIQGDFYFRPPNGGVPAPAPVVSGGGSDRETVFWSSVKDSKDASDFQAYLDKYPNGDFATLARSRLEKLKGTQTASLAPVRTDVVIEARDREMVVGRKATVRQAPNTKATVLVTLKEGDTVQVTGKVKGENWYAVERKGQPAGYVVTDTLEDPETYKARKVQQASVAPAAPVVKPVPPPVRSEVDEVKALAQQSRSAAISAQRKAVAFGQSVSDGFGVHTSPDGNRYEGEFRNNDKIGACVITYTSGYLFEGRCQAGLPNGYGVVTYPKGSRHDGRRYEGEFRDGHFSGRGVLTRPDGEIDSGIWRESKFIQPFAVAAGH